MNVHASVHDCVIVYESLTMCFGNVCVNVCVSCVCECICVNVCVDNCMFVLFCVVGDYV